MFIVHPFNLDGPVAFARAQSRCPVCQDALVRRHEGLVHVVLRRQSRGDVAYEDLLQEGRIALWQAVLHFDPQRGAAFSTYVGVAIERRIWRAVARSTRPPGSPTESPVVALFPASAPTRCALSRCHGPTCCARWPSVAPENTPSTRSTHPAASRSLCAALPPLPGQPTCCGTPRSARS
jgi:RNA polymerase sigma factor (sigma-70 family)